MNSLCLHSFCFLLVVALQFTWTHMHETWHLTQSDTDYYYTHLPQCACTNIRWILSHSFALRRFHLNLKAKKPNGTPCGLLHDLSEKLQPNFKSVLKMWGGWKMKCKPVDAHSHIVGKSLCRVYTLLGITKLRNRKAIETTEKAAKCGSRQWIRGQEMLLRHKPLELSIPNGCLGRGFWCWETRNTQWPLGTSLMMCPSAWLNVLINILLASPHECSVNPWWHGLNRRLLCRTVVY